MKRTTLILIVCLMAGGMLGILMGSQNFSLFFVGKGSEDNESCLTCHQNMLHQDTLSAKGRGPTQLIFFHSSHVDTLKLSCSPCHAKTQEAAHQTRPEKSLCLTCHDGKLAGNGCDLCHGPGAPIGIELP